MIYNIETSASNNNVMAFLEALKKLPFSAGFDYQLNFSGFNTQIDILYFDEPLLDRIKFLEDQFLSRL